MKPSLKKLLVYASVGVGLLLLVPTLYIGYLYVTYIDKTITTGSAYGFEIGQSKEEAYGAAKREFEAHRLVAVDTVHDRDEELQRYPWLDSDLPVEEALAHVDGWDHWSLSLHTADQRPLLLALVLFEGDSVSAVGQPGALGERWHPAELTRFELHHGQSRAQAATAIQGLSHADGYVGLAVSTGWMARRQPRSFAPEEFRFVEASDDWTLIVDHRHAYFNTVRLRFDSGRLVEIHRHRQYFELP